MITVILIDNHELMRASLRQILKRDIEIKVIGEAGSGIEGIQLARNLKPKVVVLNANLPDISGLEVTHRLISYAESTKILIMSLIHHDLFTSRFLKAKALGYLTRSASVEEFMQAIKTISTGERFVSQDVADRMIFIKLNPNAQNKLFLNLTDRELEVVLMVVRGFDVKKISENLHLSDHTLHSYRSRIFQKLNVNTDVELLLLAIKEGIVMPYEMEPV